ncbi:MAG: cell division topological specificity factor MinE [Clostridiales bacterium]|nr:cell division topological specificity factor MinE [Clostridiales bacterium]MCF8023504.1 cell division topological specificity factor MinE [Clostridiales bacterium]
MFKFPCKNSTSSSVAKERLRFVLLSDRTSINPELLYDLENDFIKVISKYMEIDENLLELNINKDAGNVMLKANLPVKRVKTY